MGSGKLSRNLTIGKAKRKNKGKVYDFRLLFQGFFLLYYISNSIIYH